MSVLGNLIIKRCMKETFTRFPSGGPADKAAYFGNAGCAGTANDIDRISQVTNIIDIQHHFTITAINFSYSGEVFCSFPFHWVKIQANASTSAKIGCSHTEFKLYSK